MSIEIPTMLEWNLQNSKIKIEVAKLKAEQAAEKITEYLLEQSSPSFLQQKETEDHQNSGSSPVPEASDASERDNNGSHPCPCALCILLFQRYGRQIGGD